MANAELHDREKLFSLLDGRERAVVRWLKRALTQNLLLKFTALVCAVVVWVYVDNSVMAQRTILVAVNWFTPDESYEVFWPDGTPWPDRPPAVRVQLRGLRANLMLLDPRAVCLHFDLDHAPAGKHTFALRADDLWFPGAEGFEVLSVWPQNLTLRIAKRGAAGQ